jgi:hyperosmotically inducible protein
MTGIWILILISCSLDSCLLIQIWCNFWYTTVKPIYMNTKISRLLLLPWAIAIILFSSCGVKDSAISEAITKQSESTPELAAINASVHDGVVTLSGVCKDDAAKTACENAVKSIKGVKSVVNNCTLAPLPPPPAPVVIAQDDPLTKGVTDATKDFPTVKSSVKDGVITLTGEIKRADLKKLMMTLHTLKPKKIDNQLTIK